MKAPIDIAKQALARIVDDCPDCNGYGIIPPGRSRSGQRCERCEVAREAQVDIWHAERRQA